MTIHSPEVSIVLEKETPDHYDADLVIKLYDLRREAVMRESRNAINSKFWPKNFDDVAAVTKPDHPLNVAFRQTSGYWEMVYGMARHGIVHGDFLVENNGEGLLLFARIEPYLEQFRQISSPRAFRNAEWVATHTEAGRLAMETFRARVKRALETK